MNNIQTTINQKKKIILLSIVVALIIGVISLVVFLVIEATYPKVNTSEVPNISPAIDSSSTAIDNPDNSASNTPASQDKTYYNNASPNNLPSIMASQSEWSTYESAVTDVALKAIENYYINHVVINQSIIMISAHNALSASGTPQFRYTATIDGVVTNVYFFLVPVGNSYMLDVQNISKTENLNLD